MSAGIHLSGDAHVEHLTVQGPVAGRDVVTISQDLTYDVSDLSANPYRGLASFTYASRDFYGGRDQQIEEAVRRLTRDGDQPVLLVVTGASGSGKSSFVQAGVVPALEAWYAGQGGVEVRHAVIRPGRRPLAALERGLRALELGGADSDEPGGKNGLTRALTVHRRDDRVNVIVLDQFEELFTQSNPSERQALCAALSSLGSFDEVRAHVLITLRSDYLAAVFDVPELFEPVKRAGIELRAMSRDELATAIRKPLQEQARRDAKTKRFEAALVSRLVDDVGANPTLLPLLQVTLTALWDEPPHRLTLDRYRTLTDALERQADHIYAFDREGRARTAREADELISVLLDLVEVSLDDDPRRDVRRTVAKRDLVRDSRERARLVDELVEARLLAVSVEERHGGSVELVDIIHETLLRNWPRLGEAIQGRREALQSRERLILAVSDWIEHERSDDYLLHGVRLAQARELALQEDIALRDTNARALLERSTAREAEEQQRELEQARALADEQRRRAEAEEARAEEQRLLAVEQRARAEDRDRSARRLRTWLVATAVAAVLAIAAAVTAGIAFVQADQQARVNRSRELAAAALAQADVDSAQSILLAQEAFAVSPTEQAQAALRSTLARSPVRQVLRAPSGLLSTAVFSPDGQAVLTGGNDGALHVWTAESGERRQLVQGGNAPAAASGTSTSGGSTSSNVVLARFSPDGERIVSASSDGTVRLINAINQQTIQQLRQHTGPTIVAAFSPDSTRLATSDSSGSVHLWNGRTGAAIAEYRAAHRMAVSSVAFSDDGLRLATASLDGTARLWAAPGFAFGDQAPLSEHTQLLGHSGPVLSVAFDREGQMVVTGSSDGSARIWDAASGAQLHELRHRGGVQTARFSPNGPTIVTASVDGTARLWDATLGVQIRELQGHTAPVQSAVFSPDGRAVATASQDQSAKLWDTRQGNLLVTLRGHTHPVTGVEFSANGLQIVTSSTDGTARLWRADAGHEWQTLAGHAGPVYAAAFNPSGRDLTSGGNDNTVRAWWIGSAFEASMFWTDNTATTLSYAPTGTRMALGFRNGRVGVAQFAGGENLTLDAHQGSVYTVTFSADGQRLLTTGSDRVARVWDANTGVRQLELLGHTANVTGAAFSPDQLRIATASFDGSGRIWDASTGETLHVLTGHRGEVYRIAFAQNGASVVTSGEDGSVRIWDTSNGRERSVQQRHPGAVYALAISPDGRLVASGGVDRDVLVWDASTWTVIATLRGSSGDVLHATFSPDGQRLVATSGDGMLRVYPREMFAPLDEILSLVARRVPRQPPELTADERRQYRL